MFRLSLNATGGGRVGGGKKKMFTFSQGIFPSPGAHASAECEEADSWGWFAPELMCQAHPFHAYAIYPPWQLLMLV